MKEGVVTAHFDGLLRQVADYGSRLSLRKPGTDFAGSELAAC